MWVKYELIRRRCSAQNEIFRFLKIFPIVIPIVIQKRGATPQNSSYNFFFWNLVHMISIHHCAKEQLAWLDVVKIRAPNAMVADSIQYAIWHYLCVLRVLIILKNP